VTPGRPGTPLAGVVLAAGAGTRLRPLTSLRPKALCPVGGVPLLDLALERLEPLTGNGSQVLAVNAHHDAAQVAAHLADRSGGVRLSVEAGEALGTAGALGLLRDWVAGRDVLLTNADAYLPGGLGRFAEGWDGARCRLLCVPVPGVGDFPAPQRGGRDADGHGRGLRYVGACLLPWRLVRELEARPAGLYEVMWRPEAAAGRLDVVTPGDVGAPAAALDCGTPAQYLAANLDAVRRAVGVGGSLVDPTAVVGSVRGDVVESVVGAGAVVAGTVRRCVVWDGATVTADEHLVDAVRAQGPEGPVTVTCGAGQTRSGSATGGG
jgi:MurNAc alpha-1-phosphate uridylyltransferase